jgi:zinc protease
MMEGTATKTPAALEEAIGLLGASINMYSTNEDFHITGSCLTKNFEATIAIIKEIILEPRWDQKEFDRLKHALETNLKGREANPNSIASIVYNKLLYGENHAFGVPASGTLASIKDISLDDLKAYYVNLSPKQATFNIAGAITQEQVATNLAQLNDWNSTPPTIPTFNLPENILKNTLYFVDFPNAKQSVLNIGKLTLSANDDEANNLNFANQILGSGSSGRLFQTLRIEKGYTYGAYSGISNSNEIAPFTIRSSVRANATLKSLEIIKGMVNTYAHDFSEENVALTKNKILKDNTRAYESLRAKIGMLNQISKYKKPQNFVEEDQKELVIMSLADYKTIIEKHLSEEDMIYVIVGDKTTQFEEIKKLGKNVIELDIYGNTK